MASEHIHFVTGRLAEPILREVVGNLAPSCGFDFSIDVLPISVAALMTPEWIAPRINVPAGTSRVILPGYCRGDLAPLVSRVGCPIEFGPKDVRRLAQHFGRSAEAPEFGGWDIEILAEINYANRLGRDELIRQAKQLVIEGADVIDLGCDPGQRWAQVGDCVRALRDEGIRVSIDSFDVREVREAVAGGAELVLSANRSNCAELADLGCELVVVPETTSDLPSLVDAARFLSDRRIAIRLDPILDPIGVGFAQSLLRYAKTREEWPETPMLMGIGNITELTDVDSAGANMLLAAVCQEWSIQSVLTTQVINWARSSVREFDVARRLAKYARDHQSPPKHVDSRLIMLRDPDVLSYNMRQLNQLARQVKDHNYRLFVSGDELVALGGGELFRGKDAFAMFDELMDKQSAHVDPAHAFYLGFELCKAAVARQLGKEYRQDEALNWGLLTEQEPERHRLRRRRSDGEAKTNS